jgi:hypothetical protein
MAIRNFTDLAYCRWVQAMQQRFGARDRNAELERDAQHRGDGRLECLSDGASSQRNMLARIEEFEAPLAQR